MKGVFSDPKCTIILNFIEISAKAVEEMTGNHSSLQTDRETDKVKPIFFHDTRDERLPFVTPSHAYQLNVIYIVEEIEYAMDTSDIRRNPRVSSRQRTLLGKPRNFLCRLETLGFRRMSLISMTYSLSRIAYKKIWRG